MSKERRIQALLIALLLGAGLTRSQFSNMPFLSWGILGWVALGVANAIITYRGTKWVRIISIATAFLALLVPGMLKNLEVLAWMLWVPAMVIAVSQGDDVQSTNGSSPPQPGSTDAKTTLTALILGIAMVSLLFRGLVLGNLLQTAALFVGLPTLLAILVVRTGSPRSATGVACKAVTVGLLVSLLFLGEGILCIAMAAPLFYAIAIVVGLIMDYANRPQNKRNSRLLILLFIPMSLEGVTNLTTLNRDEVISVSRIVESSRDEISEAILDTPRFDRTLPYYLRAGFPIPVSSRMDHAAGGDRWIIGFRGGETRLNGMEPSPGDLTLQLEDSRPGLLRWRAVSDSSHMTHFLDWQESTVQWKAIDARRTKVTWTLRYRRGLDPAWYFGPMERYAVRLAAGYLIDSVATP